MIAYTTRDRLVVLCGERAVERLERELEYRRRYVTRWGTADAGPWVGLDDETRLVYTRGVWL